MGLLFIDDVMWLVEAMNIARLIRKMETYIELSQE
jgi:hypothetical protein